jgi:SAM-dependent methyltransferase
MPAATQDAIEAFTERFVDAMNDAALISMASIGHRTRLFDAMGDCVERTSGELAEHAGLNERYVREWLNAMTVAGVVDHHEGSYRLPDAHAACLTRAASPNNLAVYAQYIPLGGTVEDEIVRCFREGGGVPYERFGRFHEVMAEDSGQTVLPALVDHILPLVPGLAERLRSGIDVLDLGCGRGRALLLLAERFPASRFSGYDLSHEATDWARTQAASLELGNIVFAARDLATFDVDAEPEAFDLVTTFDAVHDQPKPMALLRGIRRSLREDGVYLMQDIAGSSHVDGNRDHPMGTFLYAISTLHCMTVSLAQGGDGLGTLWGEELAAEMLHDAGFASIEVHHLEHDPQNAYTVARPGPA